MSPLVTATLVTGAVALILAAVGGWVLFRHIPSMEASETVTPMGSAPMADTYRLPARHRLGEVANPYRPRAATPIAMATIAVPVAPPAARSADTTVLPLTIHADPTPEHPAPCGFPGVTPCVCQSTPDEWFGVPNDDTRRLEVS